jgi:DMSO reductase anchor subunit
MHRNIVPLVFFTLLSQAGIGLYLVYRVCQLSTGSYSQALQGPGEKKVLFLVAALLLVAMIISFTHLGTPLHSVYALNNLSSSWLSREILCLSTLIILVCLEILTRFLKDQFGHGISLFLSLLILLAGILLVYSMTRLYMLSTVPRWNHLGTPLSFILAVCISGIVLYLLSALYFTGTLDIHPLLNRNVVRACLVILGILLLIDLASFLFITPWFSGYPVAFLLTLAMQLTGIGMVALVLSKGHLHFISLREWMAAIGFLICISLIIRRILFFFAYNRIGV